MIEKPNDTQHWQTRVSQIISNLRSQKDCPYKNSQSSRKEQHWKTSTEVTFGSIKYVSTDPPNNVQTTQLILV